MITLRQSVLSRLRKYSMYPKSVIPCEVAVQGAYNTGNIGDRIIGKTFDSELHQRGYRTFLFYRKQTNCNARHKVLGGGGLLNDWYSIESLENKFQFLSESGMIIGVGAPGVKTERGRELFREYLPKMDLITVRDEFSRQRIKEVCNVDVTVTACPSFINDAPEVEQINRTGVNFRPVFYLDSNTLSTYFGYEDGIDTDDAKNAYIQNIQQICEKVPNPVFIPFTYSDEKFAKKHLDIDVFDYRFSADRTLKKVQSVDRMVSTRYHSLIFALICNKPVMPIAYQPKVKELCERIGIRYYEPHKDISINFYDNYSIDRLKKLAMKNFDLLENKLDGTV